MSGQWMAFDVNYYLSPLAARLRERFGATGLTLWPAFLCACKKSPNPGTLTFGSDAEALLLMGLQGLDLVDGNGVKFELDEFWTLLGQLKQTKRTRRGQLVNVTSTHWERWQKTSERDNARERQRRSRALKRRDTDVTPPRHVTENVTLDTYIDKDKDLSPPTPSVEATPTPSRQGRGNSSKNGNGNPHVNGDQLVAWVRSCVPGTGVPAAAAAVNRLRQAGLADSLIEEAAGYAAENGGRSARYVEQIALEWFEQRSLSTPSRHASEPKRAFG